MTKRIALSLLVEVDDDFDSDGPSSFGFSWGGEPPLGPSITVSGGPTFSPVNFKIDDDPTALFGPDALTCDVDNWFEEPEDDEPDTDECPEHGTQLVTGHGSTRGTDPYAVNHLECGCDVVCYGPDEPNVVIASTHVTRREVEL